MRNRTGRVPDAACQITWLPLVALRHKMSGDPTGGVPGTPPALKSTAAVATLQLLSPAAAGVVNCPDVRNADASRYHVTILPEVALYQRKSVFPSFV